ncbi:MAG TPA: tetratricopeptide repeat protein [Pyrinomonadaceae bacterium]|nr:tetratricopeptide repeat protein [Pyrinomonadaceae bacterium]
MRLRPIIGWVVFMFLIAIIAQAVPSVAGSFYFVKGKRLYSKGDYRGAAAAYERSVSSDPKFARGYVELGLAYRGLEDYSQAEKAFAKAVSIEEDSCAQCGLGMVYHLQHRNSEAEAALKRAIDLNPGDECAFHQLGWLYYDEQRYKEAIGPFFTETTLRPRAVTYHFLGNAYRYTNKFDEAVKAYREGLRLDPEYKRVFVDLGHAYYGLGRYREAMNAYRQAIEADSGNVDARVALGLSEIRHGDAHEAAEQYRIIQKLDPQRAEALRDDFSRR